jgi:hypothetical protein
MMEQEELETWYALPTLIRWKDLELSNLPFPLSNLPFPLSPLANSEGFLLMYKTLEEFERQQPGKMPIIMKTRKVAV